MKDTALILVDIQNDYFTRGLWPVDNMEAVANVASAELAMARLAGDLVLHVRHEASSDAASFFRPGSDGALIHPTVAPENGEAVILKHRPNSFHKTGLEAQLRTAEISHVTIVSAMTQMCIDATARAARDLGFDVTLIARACEARAARFGDTDLSGSQVQAAFLSALEGSYATII